MSDWCLATGSFLNPIVNGGQWCEGELLFRERRRSCIGWRIIADAILVKKT